MAKKGCFGCSLPVLVIIVLVSLIVVIVALLAGPLGHSVFPNLHFPSWLSIRRPEPKLPAEAIFHIAGFPVTNTLIATWITMLFLVGLSYAVTRRLKIVPGRLQAAFESLLGWLYDLCQGVLGEGKGRKFFPLIATIFLFVGFNAWLGLIPGFGSILVHTAGGELELIRPANTDINTPLAVALVTFVLVESAGFGTLGVRYLGKFFNYREFSHGVKLLFKGDIKGAVMGMFSGIVQFFASLLEGLSEVIRIISLTFRLFGNMTAGEILLLMIAFLVPMLVPIVFYGLELLIGFIQALIFSGLTLIYLSLATSPHEEEQH